jgi:hypothetical protein
MILPSLQYVAFAVALLPAVAAQAEEGDALASWHLKTATAAEGGLELSIPSRESADIEVPTQPYRLSTFGKQAELSSCLIHRFHR